MPVASATSRTVRLDSEAVRVGTGILSIFPTRMPTSTTILDTCAAPLGTPCHEPNLSGKRDGPSPAALTHRGQARRTIGLPCDSQTPGRAGAPRRLGPRAHVAHHCSSRRVLTLRPMRRGNSRTCGVLSVWGLCRRRQGHTTVLACRPNRRAHDWLGAGAYRHRTPPSSVCWTPTSSYQWSQLTPTPPTWCMRRTHFADPPRRLPRRRRPAAELRVSECRQALVAGRERFARRELRREGSPRAQPADDSSRTAPRRSSTGRVVAPTAAAALTTTGRLATCDDFVLTGVMHSLRGS